MKVFLSPMLKQRFPAMVAAVESLGIAHTSDPTAVVDGTFHQYDSELSSASEILASHRGFVPAFVRANSGLGSIDLSFKDVLAATLKECGLPSIPSLFPRTEQEIREFFAQRGPVFCKPVLGEFSASPIVATVGLGQSALPNQDIYFYRQFDTYEQFCSVVDVLNFLDVQNGLSLASHQCLLQGCYDEATSSFFHCVGVVNGKGDYVFDFLAMIPNNVSKDQDTSLTTGMARMPAKTRSFMDQFACDPTAAREHVIQNAWNPSLPIVDEYGIQDMTKTLFDHAGVRNTAFVCQGMVIDGVPYINDVSFRVAYRYRSRDQEGIKDTIRFVLDMQPALTVIPNKFYRKIDVVIPDGLTGEMIDSARSFGFRSIVPLTVGMTIASFIAIGDSREELADKVITFVQSYNFR